MDHPTNIENPTIFWFYRIVGFGALIGAVAMSRRNDSDPYAEARRRNAAFLKDSIRRYGSGDLGAPVGRDEFCRWASASFPKGSSVVLTEDIGVSRSQILRAGTVVTVKRVDCSGMYPKVILNHERSKKVFDLYIDSSWVPFERPRLSLIRGRRL